jgi:hypothetical protein
MSRIVLCCGGASAIAVGGHALFVVWRNGDQPFRHAQAFARAIKHPLILPVWAMKLLFYPSMVGLIVFGCIILSRETGQW